MPSDEGNRKVDSCYEFKDGRDVSKTVEQIMSHYSLMRKRIKLCNSRFLSDMLLFSELTRSFNCYKGHLIDEIVCLEF